MTSEKAPTRKRYGVALKAHILAECGEAGASVAKVAMAHGINANVVHRWRQLAREGALATPAKTSGFIALPLAAPIPSNATSPDVRVEIRRGNITVQADLPMDGRSAAWLREVLG